MQGNSEPITKQTWLIASPTATSAVAAFAPTGVVAEAPA